MKLLKRLLPVVMLMGLGWALPLLMVIGLIPHSYGLNLLAFLAFMSGFILGLARLAMHVRGGRGP